MQQVPLRLWVIRGINFYDLPKNMSDQFRQSHNDEQWNKLHPDDLKGFPYRDDSEDRSQDSDLNSLDTVSNIVPLKPIP